eukprot:3111490-Pyramimonas_sp.AAC.1
MVGHPFAIEWSPVRGDLALSDPPFSLPNAGGTVAHRPIARRRRRIFKDLSRQITRDSGKFPGGEFEERF